MFLRALPLLAMLAASATFAAVTTTDSVTVQLKRGTTIVGTFDDQDQCEESKANRIAAEALTRFSGSATYQCIETRRTVARFSPNVCPTQPAPLGRVIACPAGFTGSYTQTQAYVSAPYPTCWTESGTWLPSEPPAAACVALPPPGGDGDGVPDAQDRCPTQSAATADGCPAGSVANLPVVCTSSTITEGQAISACAWTGQRFAQANSSSLVRACTAAPCTASTATWRRFGGLTANALVEVCSRPKLPNDPISGGSCSTGAGTWDAMAFVAPAQVASAPAATAMLTWTIPTVRADGSALSNLAGFRLHYGRSADVLDTPVQLGPSVGQYTLSVPAGTYFVAVEAFDASGSANRSNTVQVAVPSATPIAFAWPSPPAAGLIFAADYSSAASPLAGFGGALGAPDRRYTITYLAGAAPSGAGAYQLRINYDGSTSEPYGGQFTAGWRRSTPNPPYGARRCLRWRERFSATTNFRARNWDDGSSANWSNKTILINNGNSDSARFILTHEGNAGDLGRPAFSYRIQRDGGADYADSPMYTDIASWKAVQICLRWSSAHGARDGGYAIWVNNSNEAAPTAQRSGIVLNASGNPGDIMFGGFINKGVASNGVVEWQHTGFQVGSTFEPTFR